MAIGKLAGVAALALTLSAGAATACPMHNQMFGTWDADKDNQLSQAEFEAGLGANADFGGLDTDASGSLSQEEFDAYIGAEG